MFSNDTYNKLKWVAQYLLPGIGTLYFTLSGIWGLPYGEQIVGTLTALDAFLGVLLGISSRNYQGDGTMIVDTSDPDRDIYRMELSDPVEDLSKKSALHFKVVHDKIED